MIEVFDRRGRKLTRENPATFGRVEDFNVIPSPDGPDDLWLERELFAGLEDGVARYLTQLENVQPPRSHVRRLANEGWHLLHLLAPRHNVRLAMFVGAQMVRSPAWRDSIHRSTAVDMEQKMKEGVKEDLARATDPQEIARLEELLGIRFLTTEVPKKMLVELSGHFAYRIGKILYERFLWSVHWFPERALVIGDEPVVLSSPADSPDIGSLSQIALHKGALSVNVPLEEMVDKALEIVASSARIAMPFGPRHALVLDRLEHLRPPGRYDHPAEFAEVFNSMIALSSTQWAAWQPGMNPQVLDGHSRASAKGVA